jgi:hypothetical protein
MQTAFLSDWHSGFWPRSNSSNDTSDHELQVVSQVIYFSTRLTPDSCIKQWVINNVGLPQKPNLRRNELYFRIYLRLSFNMFASLSLRYDVYCMTVAPIAKAVRTFPVPGLYCGIFAMYFQYHASIEGTKNMLLFYALSVLYLLSTAFIVGDIVILVIDPDLPVSNNELF